jgi:hypothetical protein
MQKHRKRSVLFIVLGAGLLVFLLIQLVPFGKDHRNPPVTGEPKWNSPQTRALLKRGCFDCHSNETVYPWYASIAPSSWLLQFDIQEARGNMNFSEWSAEIDGTLMSNLIVKVVKAGSMPPPQYLLMHPEARFTAAEKEELILGVLDTLVKK